MLALACLCWSSPNMQGYVLFSSVTSNDFLYLTTQSTGCHFYWPRFRIQRINADLVLLWCIVPSLQIIYSIKLPGKVILGEGKPENQNHAIIFTRGDAIQTIDMNQVSGGAFLQLLACPEISVNVFAQVMLLQFIHLMQLAWRKVSHNSGHGRCFTGSFLRGSFESKEPSRGVWLQAWPASSNYSWSSWTCLHWEVRENHSKS